jgi:hypothetical protein
MDPGKQKIFLPGNGSRGSRGTKRSFSSRLFFRERRSFFFQGIDQGIDQGEDLFSQEKDYLVYLVYNVI